MPMNLEDELRNALRREPAPANFAAGVLAKTRVRSFWQRPAILALAAGLAITALVPQAMRQYHTRQRAIEAKDQLIMAFAITKAQLRHTKEKLQHNTRQKL
jgi:hypothetical protein